MPTTIERTVDVEHRVEVLAHEAQIRRAQERLLRIEDMRAASQLKQSGMTQREIADVLRTTQPRVGRLLRGASALGDAPTLRKSSCLPQSVRSPRQAAETTLRPRLHLHPVRALSPREIGTGDVDSGEYCPSTRTTQRRGIRVSAPQSTRRLRNRVHSQLPALHDGAVRCSPHGGAVPQ